MPKSEFILEQRRFEHLKSATQQAGIKLTHQRLEIFRELANTQEHPDAETLFRAVQQRVPTVSLDTVYRTLWTLHEMGLVTTLGPQRDGIRFDANLDSHHHFVCVHCGKVRDFESDELNEQRVSKAVQHLGRIVDAHVEVRGICPSCQSQSKTQKPQLKPTAKTKKRSQS